MTAAPEPIERRDFVTATLMGEYRLAWHDPNKRIVFEIACPPGATHAGRLAYSRWTAMPLPESLDGAAVGRLVRVLDGYYDYAPSLDPGTAARHRAITSARGGSPHRPDGV